MIYDIVSSQENVHRQLVGIVKKHQHTAYQAPIPDSSKRAFETVQAWITQPLILDLGCGTGMSTLTLGKQYPDHFVLGIDKSQARLQKNGALPPNTRKDNVGLCRVELSSFLQILAKSTLTIDKCYCLYPNPWPKASQFKRRLHGHPIFPTLLSLSRSLEIRSNWLIYLEEFLQATTLIGTHTGTLEQFKATTPLTLFEKKYLANAVSTYRLCLTT